MAISGVGASMARRGLVTAVALGVSPLIYACTMTEVVSVEIGVVTMHPSEASLLDGQTLRFTATVTDTDGTLLPGAVVTWDTDDPDVVSIDDEGMLEALRAGAATVVASFHGVQGNASVTVFPAPRPILGEDSVAFYAAVGAESPTPAVVEVLNSGVGAVDGLEASVEYPTGQPGGWLTPTLGATTTPTTLTLTPATSALAGGTYEATVLLDATGGDEPLPISVYLSVTGVQVTESDGSTTVTESGETDGLTVILAAEPTSEVVVDLVSADPTEATLTPTRLTFSPSTWDQPRSVTVSGPDDLVLDGDVTTLITLTVVDELSDPAFAVGPDNSLLVTTIDDEVAGFTVVESEGRTVVAGGGSDDLQVLLNVEPVSDVVVRVSSADPGEVAVSPATLRFTPDDWSTPQQVVVTGVGASPADGERSTDVTLGIDDDASDDGFDGLPDQTVAVITVGGFSVLETNGSTVVTEAGLTDTLSVVLEVEPASDVVVDVLSGDPTEATVNPIRLTFKPSNWDDAQIVTVTAPDDLILDGDLTTTLTLTVVDDRSDPGFAGVPDLTVSVSTVDDEQAGFTVVESGERTVVAGTGSDDFTVALDVQPTSVVVIDVSSEDPGEVTVLPATLIFTPDDWATPQVVQVTGVGNAVGDQDQSTDVVLAVNDLASADGFDDVPDQIVTVYRTGGLSLEESDGTTVVSESGLEDTFTVVLEVQPIADVVVDVISHDETEATVNPIRLTFKPSDWDEPQEVKVKAPDDEVLDGDGATEVTVTVVDALSDPAFGQVPDLAVVVTTLDDEEAGFTVRESRGRTRVGDGRDDTFTVQLDAQPASDVVIKVVVADPDLIAVSEVALTFTPEDWDDRQRVVVTAVEGGGDDVEESSITLSVDDELSDDHFDAVPDQSITVEIDD